MVYNFYIQFKYILVNVFIIIIILIYYVYICYIMIVYIFNLCIYFKFCLDFFSKLIIKNFNLIGKLYYIVIIIIIIIKYFCLYLQLFFLIERYYQNIRCLVLKLSYGSG